MKRVFALILALSIMCSCVGAFAESEYDKVWFSIETSSTSVFSVGHSPVDKWMYDWYIGISDRSNVSPTHRAVGRVHWGATAISATWVFTGESYNHHGYYEDYDWYLDGVTFRARLDNRDSGMLNFYGYFYY